MPNGVGKKYSQTAKRTRAGLPVFTGKINLDRDSLDLPRSWRLPRLVFVNSMSDVFHEHVPISYIQEIFQVMKDCSQHTFQVLTKRPERACKLAPDLPWPHNVWMGTSVEDGRVLGRVDALREIPAHVRFLSCEPLIGSLGRISLKAIDWVIVGGESGPGARPMKEEWVLEIKQRCNRASVPFFFKQWGGVNKKAAGRILKGQVWDELPNK